MTHVRDLHEQWMQDPAYRNAYEQLEPEFALARALIEARTKAGLTQAQLADMHTTQSVIARLEGGQVQPSTRTLERFAKATGTRLKISFEACWRLVDAGACLVVSTSGVTAGQEGRSHPRRKPRALQSELLPRNKRRLG